MDAVEILYSIFQSSADGKELQYLALEWSYFDDSLHDAKSIPFGFQI